MFGKRVSEYLAFEKVWLFLIAAVGLVRLGLSLAGLADHTVAWFSMNVVVWAGALYFGAAVYTKGFGSYKQLLPLMIFATLTMQSIAVLGILLSIAGTPERLHGSGIQLRRAEPVDPSARAPHHRARRRRRCSCGPSRRSSCS